MIHDGKRNMNGIALDSNEFKLEICAFLQCFSGFGYGKDFNFQYVRAYTFSKSYSRLRFIIQWMEGRQWEQVPVGTAMHPGSGL